MEMTIDKTMVSRAVISKIEDEKHPKQIRAKHVKGFDEPEKFSVKGKEEQIIPDISVSYENETHIYEIELDKKLHTDKWRYLSLYAKKKNGNFYIVAPDYIKENIKEVIKNQDINAGIIFFSTNNNN